MDARLTMTEYIKAFEIKEAGLVETIKQLQKELDEARELNRKYEDALAIIHEKCCDMGFGE